MLPGVENVSSDWPTLSDEEYYQEVWEAIKPNWLEYAYLPIFATLLVCGLSGNSLVVFVVVKNESMRTVTNLFLVNLALADFMVLLFCLPFTVLWEITRTWWFGTAMCKIIVYCQTVSVSVSVLTLTCISVERWYAICYPLAFKNTYQRTLTMLILIWLMALALSSPELIILQTKRPELPRANYSAPYMTACTHTWSNNMQQVYQLTQMLVLYVVPLCLMAAMYGHIAYVLWVKSIPPSDPSFAYRYRPCSTSPSATAHFLQVSSFIGENGFGRQRPSSSLSERTRTDSDNGKVVPVGGSSLVTATTGRDCVKWTVSWSLEQTREREITNRRKAAKMLIAVVVLFAICYLPTHMLNILTYFNYAPELGLDASRSAFYLSIRLLCYFNSCINPLVYNMMSEKFRKEFRRACRRLPPRLQNGNVSRYVTTQESSALLPRNRVLI